MTLVRAEQETSYQLGYKELTHKSTGAGHPAGGNVFPRLYVVTDQADGACAKWTRMRFRCLYDKQIAGIRDTALHILKKTGMYIGRMAPRQALMAGRVREQNGRFLFSETVVQNAL